jgi:hypothetical protein
MCPKYAKRRTSANLTPAPISEINAAATADGASHIPASPLSPRLCLHQQFQRHPGAFGFDQQGDLIMAKPNRIDVHHHIAPPEYIQALSPAARMPPPLKNWTPERSIETMDEGGVDLSLTSITLPGLWFGDLAKARRMARMCNDYAA